MDDLAARLRAGRYDQLVRQLALIAEAVEEMREVLERLMAADRRDRP